MPFSVSFGACLMYLTILLILPEQGHPRCDRPTPRGPGSPVTPPCCTAVSNATIQEPVASCTEQRATTFRHCRIHAFLFIAESQRKYCVDPAAPWLNRRLERLEKRQICCNIQ